MCQVRYAQLYVAQCMWICLMQCFGCTGYREVSACRGCAKPLLKSLECFQLIVLSTADIQAVHLTTSLATCWPGDLVWSDGAAASIWAAPLEGGGRALVALNRAASAGSPAAHIDVSWQLLGYEDDTEADVRDLFERRTLLRGVTRGFSMRVGRGAAAVLRVTPLQPQPHHAMWRPWRVVSTGQQAAWVRSAAAFGARDRAVMVARGELGALSDAATVAVRARRDRRAYIKRVESV